MTAISPLTPDAYATQQVYQARRSLDDSQMLNEVAGRLGIEPSKLQDAIQQARIDGKDGKDLLASVANQLGIQPDTLQQAFMQAGRGPGCTGTIITTITPSRPPAQPRLNRNRSPRPRSRQRTATSTSAPERPRRHCELQ